MAPLALVLMAIGLGADAFSVALSVGGRWADARSRFRLSFHFGLFQFLMPIIGWLAGRQILPLIRAWDHWLVFAILMVIAIKMLVESFRAEEDEEQVSSNPTKGWSLVGLSVATSLDALGVGFTLGHMKSGVVAYAAVIGVVAATMTLTGMVAAHHAARAWGVWAERAGAGVLAIVAFKLLGT